MKILGIDIGGTFLKVCIANEYGHIESFREFRSHAGKGAASLMDQVMDIVGTYPGIDAIGISTAGQVNRGDGSIIYGNENIPGYTGTKVKARIQERFGIPILVENDVHAAAMGEKYFGAGSQLNDFLCVTYGTGVGGAIVIDSQIYGGTKGIAAEFGHIITHPGGRLCNCGQSGCYEMYASTTALVKEAQLLHSKYVHGRTIFADYEKGIVELKKVMNNWMYEVAIGLVSLVHVFNPTVIIVGGGIMEQSSIVAHIEKHVQQLTMESFSDVKLMSAELGNKAGALGAVSLHLEAIRKGGSDD